jgi:tRNA dimethylallyltransferase
MQKCIVICGQTGTGKSDLAVEIALFLKKNGVNSEIISADSRQVYTGFDVTSAKITTKEMFGVHHHMLSVTNPKKDYSVNKYKKEVTKIIKKLGKNKTLPIICGGTGLYIDNVVYKQTIPEVKPNTKLRNELDKLTTLELFNLLKNKDPKRAENIDSKNKRRLIRALEIIEELGTVPETIEPKLIYDTLFIGLVLPSDNLKERISERTNKRIKKGMLEEIKSLHNSGLSYDRLISFGMEYKWLTLYIQNKITKEECITRLNQDTFKYAKRQITWFKKNKLIHWLDTSQPKESQKSAIKMTMDFLSS